MKARNANVLRTDGGPTRERKGIGAVEIAVDLLKTIEQASGQVSLTEIARQAGFAPSKTHHYLVSLVRTGLVRQDPVSGLYELGSYALQLGVAALEGTDATRLSLETVRSFRDTTGQTVFFAVWGDAGPMILHAEEGTHAVAVSVRSGTTLPILTSPTGQVFLAWMPESLTRPLVGAARKRTALSERQVDEIKARVRREGAAYHAGKRTPTIAAISAPVFAHDGRLAGALTAMGLVGQFDETPDSPVAKALIAHTVALSKSLGVRKAP